MITNTVVTPEYLPISDEPADLLTKPAAPCNSFLPVLPFLSLPHKHFTFCLCFFVLVCFFLYCFLLCSWHSGGAPPPGQPASPTIWSRVASAPISGDAWTPPPGYNGDVSSPHDWVGFFGIALYALYLDRADPSSPAYGEAFAAPGALGVPYAVGDMGCADELVSTSRSLKGLQRQADIISAFALCFNMGISAHRDTERHIPVRPGIPAGNAPRRQPTCMLHLFTDRGLVSWGDLTCCPGGHTLLCPPSFNRTAADVRKRHPWRLPASLAPTPTCGPILA